MSSGPETESLTFPLGDGVRVRPVQPADAEPLYAVVVRHRSFLSEWLPWAPDQTLEITQQFVAHSERQSASDLGFQGVILDGVQLVGAIGFHAIDWPNSATTIGYWLAEDAQGRGIMTRAVRALTDHAFGAWDLHRVEISAATDNHRSRAIPTRLGFVEEGVRREAERVAGRFLDLVVYGMLARDWPTQS